MLTAIFLLFTTTALAQELDTHSRSPRPNSGSKQQQRADKKKAIQQKKIARGIEKGKQRHLKLQTKNTKKMMKQSRKKSKKWNDR